MSENINGGLAFAATLDINDFRVSSEAMERRIRGVSDTAILESEKMERSIQSFAQNGAKYIIGTLVAGGMTSLVSSIIQTRGQFQQLDIAFETMLGSASKSKALMDQITNTAAKTPFDLMGVASGAKQLLAYGASADKVNDTLVRLGNIASGLSIPLGDMVYLYGTTQTQGRLFTQDVRQFMGRGIPLVKEMATMLGKTEEEINNMVTAGKIGFPEVEKVINKMTDSGGQFFNLMEKQSKSLTGMISNLGDAWDSAMNKLGADNQDVFAAGIEGASYLVENLDDILRIVKAIAIGYGSYKAAIVANTLVTKGHTGVALIDNTVRQAKMSLMKADEAITGKAAAVTAKMTAAQEAHTASLQKQLTVEEQSNLVKQLKIATIQQLLTAQQQEYLSNIGVTTSSANYEAVAMSVLSVEQRMALAKTDLSSKSAIYQAVLKREVMAKNQNQTATLAAMRTDVKAAAARVESAKQDAVAANSMVDQLNYEVYMAKQSGDVTRLATAEKKLEGAVENQAITRKAALSAQSDFYSKKKVLEATATKQSTVASATDTVAKTTQGTVTTVLTAITTKCTLALKAMWASMMSNPIGWILGLVGALVSIFTLFGDSEEEAADAMGEFQDTTKKEIDNLNMLMAVLKNTEVGTKAHKQALEKVNSILQEYNKELITESATVDQLNGKYKELTDAINASAAARIKAKYIEKYQQEQASVQEEAKNKFKDEGQNLKEYTYTPSGGMYGGNTVTQTSIKSIQEMGDEVYDYIEVMAMEAADRLKNLTGDAYTKAYAKTLNDIRSYVKDVTKSSDKDMDIFSSNISKYFNNVISSSTELDGKINKLNKSSEAFAKVGEEVPPIVKTVDYAKMSFSELDKLVKDSQGEIDKINAKTEKVDTDNTRLTELLGLINQVNGAIDNKTQNLNTESGINARIKELQDERSNVEINGEKYKQLSATIRDLQKRLPNNSKNGDDGAAKKAEQLAEKQRQAEMKAEQSRINVLEEGYEKRKALSDLQHQQNLAAIDKEERELEKARKEAGKGGLSSKEKQGFSDRRENENTSYNRDHNKLFDGEISYKKSQYELYFRWVENMGADVADKQFASLLKDGNSYKAYVEQQIQQLSGKQAAGTLTEGEGNNLIALKVQYDEITGAKTAMDTFKDSVTQAISRASTLAEKIQAIADAKERLANGSTGLNPDEKLNVQKDLDNRDVEAQKELQNRLLTEFKTFEEQKKAIQDEYTLLRNAAMAQQNADLLAQVNRGEAEALSTLNAQMLMQTDSWRNLFNNLDSLTASQISNLINKINDNMSDLNITMDPADLKAVLDRLQQAEQEILKKNPFKALQDSYSRMINSYKALDKAKKDGLSGDELKKFEQMVILSAQNVAAAIGGVAGIVTEVGSSLSNLANSFGDEKLADDISFAMEMVEGLGKTAGGVAKIMAGDVVGGVKDVITGIADTISSIFNQKDKNSERKIQSMQIEVEKLQKSYERLGRAIDQTYSNNVFTLMDQQEESLVQQRKLIEQQIEAEKSKKKTDWDKIADWEDQMEQIDNTIEDSKRKQMEMLAGTDVKSAIDEFADALIEAYGKGEDAAGALGETTKKVMANAVKEALKKKFLADEIEKAVNYLSTAMSDGTLTNDEQANFEDIVNNAGDRFSHALEAYDKLFKDTDIDIDKTEDPMTGAVRSMSEETGSLVAGRLNAVVIGQSDSLSVLRQSLIHHKQIADNTGESAKALGEIKDTLKRMESKDSSLLSQGIS